MTTDRHILANGDFFQDWSNAGLITTSDDWSGVPSIVGYRGDDITAATGADPQTLLGDGTITVDVNANQTNPDTFTTGGVAEFAISNPVVALNGSGTADAPHLVVYLDATGRENIVFSFNARDIDGSADNAVQPIAVQYRLADSGPWINLPAGFIADASQGPSLAGGSIPVSVTLPSAANNAANLQVRVITANASGNDEWIGIDDIRVTSSAIVVAQPGELSIADASIAEGDSGETALTFTVTRAGGSAGAVSADYSVALGTADSLDFVAGSALGGTVSFADGQLSSTITIRIAGDTMVEADEDFTVTLSAPTGGATLGDAVATGTIRNDDVAPPAPANVFINEIHYDNSGADVGESVEVAGLAGTDLTGWSIVLYNGNDRASYSTIALAGVLPDQDDGYGTLAFAAPGIQNGAPDGLALVNASGQVVQFLSYEGSFTAANGPAAGMTSTDIGVAETGSEPAGQSLQLTGSGSAYEDFVWAPVQAATANAVNAGQDFIGPNATGQVSVADVSVREGDAGVTELVFVIKRAGGSAQAASVDYAITLDTANSADLAPGAILTGTASFAIGSSTARVVIPVQGDTVGELNETLSIALSNPVGNIVIVDGSATGTIVNDDPLALTIMQIQGEQHRSEFAGQVVTTSGIVTAVDSDGFYLQDAAGDGNRRTSDGIFVFTGTAPTVAIGHAVSVTGTVAEILPGNNPDNLTVTQLRDVSVTTQTVGNALPAAVVIGSVPGGILPPTETLDDDGFAVFDPENDGLDFYESLEGMRVTIDNPIVTFGTNGFGETQVVASGGAGATGVNARGGITVSPGDFNPERIQIDDDSGLFGGFTPAYSQGDRLSSVTGVVNYNFTSYEVLVTEAVTLTTDVTLEEETTTLRGDEDNLSIATYNVENLDPTDTKFDILSNDIVFNLGAPDIIALQEIQDADGAGTGSNLSGAVTAQRLIDAIALLGGPNYVYVEVAPATPNSTGGEPNGNIRNGYLYNADRVNYLAGSAELVQGSAFNGSRNPLSAQFEFNGQVVMAINVHSTSRIGSDPLTGSTQPPVNAGDAARTAQATAIAAYLNAELATNPNLEFAVLGDFNGFYFETAVNTLVTTAGLTRLGDLLPEEERYSFVFDGNAQQIDHILVSGGLVPGAQYDAVHINAERPGAVRGTDHDPQLALLNIPAPNRAPVANDDEISVDEDATTADLSTTLLGNDFDPNKGDTIRISAVDGQQTVGTLIFDAETGTLRYSADNDAFDELRPGETATDSFVYTISDEDGLTSSATVSVTVNGVADPGDTITGTARADLLTGTDGDDFILGLNGNDTISGGRGHDSIDGGQGRDTIDGGSGDDIIDGGLGNDRLTGGTGEDSFIFGLFRGNDTITDFNTAEDRIVLEDGARVAQSRVSDVNRDGITDLTISVTLGTNIILLGVSDFSQVRIDQVSGGDDMVIASGGARLADPWALDALL